MTEGETDQDTLKSLPAPPKQKESQYHTKSFSRTDQDASLTLSRTSLGFTLLLPVATPVVTKAMICQSVFIFPVGYLLFSFNVR